MYHTLAAKSVSIFTLFANTVKVVYQYIMYNLMSLPQTLFTGHICSMALRKVYFAK